VTPDFLDADKWYEATIYHDGPGADWKANPEAYQIEKKLVSRESVMNIALAPGGGCAISFMPLTAEKKIQYKKEMDKLNKQKKNKIKP
jgi:hypothetical protein